MKKRASYILGILLLLFLVFYSSFIAVGKEKQLPITLHQVVGPNGIPYSIADSSSGFSIGFMRQTDGTLSLIRYDHETLETMPWSAFVVDDDTLHFELSECIGGFSPVVDGNLIYEIKVGFVDNNNFSNTFISRYDLIACDWKDVYFDNTRTLSLTSGILSDGEDLYFISLEVNPKNGLVKNAYLSKTDFEKNSITDLFAFPAIENECYAIHDGFDDNIVLQKMVVPLNIDKDHYEMFPDKAQFAIEIFSLSDLTIHPTGIHWVNGETSISTSNNKLYMGKNGNELLITDLATESVSTLKVSCYLDNWEKFVFSGQVFDNHSFAYLIDSNNNVLAYGGIDLDTGFFRETQLTYTDSDGIIFPMTIISENDSQFFVICGAEYRFENDFLSDGTEYNYERRYIKYGLINKDDYWTNKNTVRPFISVLTP